MQFIKRTSFKNRFEVEVNILIPKIGSIYKKQEEIINYLIVGVLTTIVSLGSYYIIGSTLLNPEKAFELQLANLFSWVCAVTFSYFVNRRYVFKIRGRHHLREVFSFISARILTLLLDMTIMFLTVTLLKMNDKIAKIIVQVVVTLVNYFLSKWFVFKK